MGNLRENVIPQHIGGLWSGKPRLKFLLIINVENAAKEKKTFDPFPILHHVFSLFETTCVERKTRYAQHLSDVVG